MTFFTYGTPGDPRTISESVGYMVESVETLFGSGNLADRPAAVDAPRGWWEDEFGTVWRSNGTLWMFMGGEPPRVSLTRSAQALANASEEDVLWDGELEDEWTMHGATGTAAITPEYNGLWLLEGQVTFEADADGFRRIKLNRSGTTVVQQSMPAVNGDTTVMGFARAVRLSSTTPVVLRAYQTSGDSREVTAALSLTMLATTP